MSLDPSADTIWRQIAFASTAHPYTHPGIAPDVVHADVLHEVADLLAALLAGMREAFGNNLIGIYLRGSLAMGDFEPGTSDIDFFAVTERRVSDAEFAALADMHAWLDRLPNRYAQQLEGPYIDRAAARRFRPGQRHPTIARGEALAWSEHSYNWVLERWMVRKDGLALLGPDPRALIDSATPDELRTAVRLRLRDWVAWVDQPDDPEWLLPRRHHMAYVVETMCRALYTLACGALASKQRAVAWALDTLSEPWRTTVERSRTWHGDTETIDPGIVPEVMRFVRWIASHADGSG
jgi:hypothetical protein